MCEDNKIINYSNEVSNLFNNFFPTVAEKIGENVVYDPSNHPSITAIHENNSIELNGKFGFQKVTSEKVEKIINKINVNQRLPGAFYPSPGSKLLSITMQLHCGGHLGGRARLPDTILEEDHPMTIPSKFGSN